MKHQFEKTGVTIDTNPSFPEKRCKVCGAVNWGGSEDGNCPGAFVHFMQDAVYDEDQPGFIWWKARWYDLSKREDIDALRERLGHHKLGIRDGESSR